MLDTLDKLDKSSDNVPPMYEGMKCYPFDIEIKKPMRPANQSRGASFFGDILKKWTAH